MDEEKNSQWFLSPMLKLEFQATAQDICMALWIKYILNNLDISDQRPIKLFYDNKLVIEITKNPIYHNCAKHIEVNQHFIKEKLDNGIIYSTYLFSRGVNVI